MTGARGYAARDVALSVALFAVVCADLHFLWPNSLIALDEGEFLYASKRILDGQVMYRDFFDLMGPVANYAVTLSFALFGVSMETARGTMAVLHGIIVVLMYSIVRRLGVRPTLGAAVCLTHIALFYPALPISSWHWFSTAFTLVVFLSILREPVRRIGQALALGALTALVALTQQPKGGATAAAVGIVLVRDVWTECRAGSLTRAIGRQLGAYALGLLGIVVPVVLGFVVAGGFEPVFDALVRMPLGPYRQLPFHRAGGWMPFVFTPAELLSLLAEPSAVMLLNITLFVVPITGARLVWQAVRGASADDRRPLFVALVFSIFAIVSVMYQLNNTHFAVVGPIWLSMVAEFLEWLVQCVERGWGMRLVRPLTTVAVLVLLALQLRSACATEWKRLGVACDTPFGRVHLHSEGEVDEIQALRATLQAAGAKDLFVYPYGATLYLMTETSNPTRFQVLIPGFNTPDQFAEVRETLERERVPFVVRTVWLWRGAPDPLLPYLSERYEGLRLPRKYRTFPTISVFRRRVDDAATTAR